MRQSGVALAILLWFLAAMSILVASIVFQARMDIKLAQLQIGHAEAEAAGDGAIHLALAQLLIQEQEDGLPGKGTPGGEFVFGDVKVGVSITPVTGLVDLNLASEELLTLLFASVEGQSEASGLVLARNVVEWRAAGAEADVHAAAGEDAAATGPPRQGQFEAVEDLLLVQGIERDVFEKVEESVYVAMQGQAGVDWQSAPVSVLALLNSGDRTSALELVRSRLLDPSGNTGPPPGMNMAFQEQQALTLFRVDALMTVGGVDYRRRRWVDRATLGADGLPWRFFRTEPVTALTSKEIAMRKFLEGAYAGS